MSARRIVLVSENFSGPWSAQFSCPMTVYLPGNIRKLAILVTDPGTTIPKDAEVHELGPLDTLAGVLERAGVSRSPILPPPEPRIAPRVESVIEATIPETIILPPSEDITDPPLINPPTLEPEVKPSLFSRAKNFFKRK